MFWILLLFLHTRIRTNVVVAKAIKAISTMSIEPSLEKIFEDSTSLSSYFMDVLLNSLFIGSVNQWYGMNSPRAITRNDVIAILAFGGYWVFHSVKKTTNCKVFPVITALAPAIAELLRSAICSPSSGSIYRGRVTYRESSSIMTPNYGSNEIERESGYWGSLDTYKGSEYTIFSSMNSSVALVNFICYIEVFFFLYISFSSVYNFILINFDSCSNLASE